jgi:DNA repair exonuclease SbcCD nuclease subunit
VVDLRIGVFSDTHIGRSVPKAIGELRREAYRIAFQRAIDIFVKEGVDYVVHAGDLFERRSMSSEDSIFVKNELQRLIDSIHESHRSDVKIFVVRGNHDGTPGNCALDYVKHPLAKYLLVLGDDLLMGKEEIYSDGRVAVAGIGYHPYISSRFEKVKGILSNVLSSSEGFKILIMHNFISGYHDVPPGTPQHSLIDLASLKELDTDVIVCGHYHTRANPMRLEDDRGILVSPGSTDAIDLSDEGPHGVMIVEDGECRFVPIQTLHVIRSESVKTKGEVRPIQWFKQNALDIANEFANSLKDRQGILRIVLEGLTDGDPFDIDSALDSVIAKIKSSTPSLLHIELVNRVQSISHPFIPPALGGRTEFITEALRPLGELVDEAMQIVESVDHELEERRSQKTGLLTDSTRKPFVQKWIEILEKVSGH